MKKITIFFVFLPVLFYASLAQGDGNFFQDSLSLTGNESGYSNQRIFSAGEGGLEGGVGNIIQAVLSLIGVLFLGLLVFGGIKWMTAGGNEDIIKKAKSRIVNAIIGLAIVLFAYGITAFIFKNLPSNISGGTTPISGA